MFATLCVGPRLEPILERINISWDQIKETAIKGKFVDILIDCDDMQAILGKLSSPMALLEDVRQDFIPMLVENLGPKLDPLLNKFALTWNDIKGTNIKDKFNEVLTACSSMDDIMEKLGSPMVRAARAKKQHARDSWLRRPDGLTGACAHCGLQTRPCGRRCSRSRARR